MIETGWVRSAGSGTHRPGARAPSVTLVAPPDLDEADLAAWRRFQGQDTALASPFLCPDFTRIAAEVRRGVEVAVMRQDGAALAFLPFERRGRTGGPVAGAMSDCQAVLADARLDLDVRALVRAAGLSVHDFTFAREAQAPFRPFHRSLCTSHLIDLSAGFEAYLRERREAGRFLPDGSSGLPHHALQRARRLERQAGPLRFALHDPDPATLRRLIDWKRQHYRRTGAPDVFARRWTVELLERIHAMQSPSFAGVLSTLSVGRQVIAAHMGMRSRDVLHWWFPSYDIAQARHSPGIILLVELCRAAAQQGIRIIELGPGDEGYKLLMANARIPMAAGHIVARPSLSASWRGIRHGMEGIAARMPLGRYAGWPAKLFRRVETAMRLR
ncbi:GNAT family N-acetyltransferase [Falsiroseomonas sp.]|uniref:GNAT family N-acetyltransferase n=1 Tax=Falsiroseomonas sp. TaxID=2870721 RepID=UPI0034A47939